MSTSTLHSNNATQEAARALARGDPLRALALVGTVEGARSTMLRGIAYAQLGDLELAKTSLEQTLGASDDPHIRATARAALAEIALNSGDPAIASRDAAATARDLDALGDTRNAAMQRLTHARAEVLLGRLGEARRAIEGVLAQRDLPRDLVALASLAEAEIAIRSTQAPAARDAIARAGRALASAPNPILSRALDMLDDELSKPIARLVTNGATRPADLFAIHDASSETRLFVDACHRTVSAGRVTVHLARRPVLFAILSLLARAWPASVPRDALAAGAFDVRKVNASHRSRLRVEIGRLRSEMTGLDAAPRATADGYVLDSLREIALLLPPSDDEHAHVALLMGDGALWSAQSLADHIGVSKRTTQRALAALVEKGAVTTHGKGRDLRYFRPGTPIASRMLLLGLVPTS